MLRRQAPAAKPRASKICAAQAVKLRLGNVESGQLLGDVVDQRREVEQHAETGSRAASRPRRSAAWRRSPGSRAGRPRRRRLRDASMTGRAGRRAACEQSVRARSGDIRSAPSGRRSGRTAPSSRRSRSARRSGVSAGFAASSISHSISRQRPCGCRATRRTPRRPRRRISESGSSPAGRMAKRRLRPGFSSGSARSSARGGGALAGRVAVEAQDRLGRRAATARCICTSVSAVPSGATAPPNPARCSAITSM